ncbi:MAG: hypothetical protein ACOCVF_01960 [bacterium]
MKLKGTFKQKYTLDRELKELVVKVELKKVEGLLEPRQNIWYSIATANDKIINDKSLPYCVNAEYAANRLGKKIIAAWKVRAKKEGKSFRLKK